MRQKKLAHLVVGNGLLGALHRISAVAGVPDEAKAERTPAVKVSGEFRYT